MVIVKYSQSCIQRPPLGLKKVTGVQKVAVIQRLVLKKQLIRLAIVDRWPLFRGGC
jgi:hypothetical protein